MRQGDSAKDEKNMIIKYVLIGFTQPLDKLEVIALKDLHVIASQCAHWRGNPHPLTHLDDETAKKGERIATGDLRSPSQ